MNKVVHTTIAILLLAASFYSAAVELPDFKTLVKRCGPAVVNISTRQSTGRSGQLNQFHVPDIPDNSPLQELFRQFFGDQSNIPEEAMRSRSLGSGFFISSDGYILTNYHVVDSADEIIVRTSDRSEFEATVIGSDQSSDTALIKIEIKDAPVLELGTAHDLEVGDWVLAIGSPFGFDHSVTQGIVSALGRSLPSENYVPFIQTDVAINPGNSGGPLLNLEGKVVGVNSQIYSRTGGFMGLSFSIPIDLAKNVAHQLRYKGRVSRGWLGVRIQDIDRNLAKTFNMASPKGALVAQVLPDSPAAEAGLQVGDVIVAYNSHALETSSALPPLVGESELGSYATLNILRDGKEREIKIKIAELPREDALSRLDDEGTAPGPGISSRLGLVVRDTTPQERKELGLKKGEGAVIDRLTKGAAKAAGLMPGDVILIFNNVPIQGGAVELRKQIETLPKDELIAILLQRGEDRLFLALRLP